MSDVDRESLQEPFERDPTVGPEPLKASTAHDDAVLEAAVSHTSVEDALVAAQPHRTQRELVARQFKKKKTAVWGLRITQVLVLLAIYAPVIAASQPYGYTPVTVVEKTGELVQGEREHPWFTHLFDVIVWEHVLDRLFNLIMVALTVYLLGKLVLWAVMRDRTRRVRVQGRWRTAVIVLTVLIAILQLHNQQRATEWGLLTSNPKVDYLGPHKAWRATYDELEDKRAALTEAQAAGGRDIPRLEKSVQEAEQKEAEAREFLDAHEITTTPIPYGPSEQLPSPKDKFLGFFTFDKGERHLFGTGETGRDIFVRILYGTRIALTIGIVAVGIYLSIGTVLGALAGFFGGKVDLTIMRIVEVVICIPALFLMLTIVALFEERSIFLIMFAIGIVAWTGITRLVRGEFLRERHKEYVDAARSMGFSTPRIIFRHILPNAVGPVLVAATFGIPAAILAESGLSFLGLGDVSVPSWGRILFDARTHPYWHLIIPPSVAIFITVTALNLVGDGLRDALDPKLRA